MNPETYASRAGGLKTFAKPLRFSHDKTPHVYVVYWPDQAVIKVGMSNKVRWRAWRGRGAVEIATLDTCCMSHAHTIERWLLAYLKMDAKPAFASRDASRVILGDGVGWTECYQLEVGPFFGDPSQHAVDYGRSYGLDYPTNLFEALLRHESTAWHPVAGWVEPDPSVAARGATS